MLVRERPNILAEYLCGWEDKVLDVIFLILWFHLTRRRPSTCRFFFFLNDPAPTEIYPLPHHDALPISADGRVPRPHADAAVGRVATERRLDTRRRLTRKDAAVDGRPSRLRQRVLGVSGGEHGRHTRGS